MSNKWKQLSLDGVGETMNEHEQTVLDIINQVGFIWSYDAYNVPSKEIQQAILSLRQQGYIVDLLTYNNPTVNFDLLPKYSVNGWWQYPDK